MIKYVVRKDINIELKKSYKSMSYSIEDLLDYQNNQRSYNNNEEIEGFRTIEEAKECFRYEKNFCKSFDNGNIIIFDYLSLWKEEYEEDDYIQGELLDEFVAEIN